MSSRPSLLLFDAAGTLIEPAEPVERVYKRHFAAAGHDADEAAIRASFRATFGGLAEPDFTGHPDGDLAERAWWREVVGRTAAAAGIPPENSAACFDGLFDHYAAGSAWRAFPEVRGVLERVRATGARMAVVSNFDRRLHRVLGELGLDGYFDAVLTSADVAARKPSPVLLEAAIARFAIDPGMTRLVGDSLYADGGAATAAGIGAFILDRPRTTLLDFEGWLE